MLRLLISLALLAPACLADEYLVYFGTYTRDASKGIYVARFDSGTGALSGLTLAAETPSPSFLAIHPNARYLYAVNEVSEFQGDKAGAVSAFSIDRASGKLTPLNQVSSKGAGPCYITIDKTGKNALIANYVGGSVAAYQIGADGKLSQASSFIQHAGSSVNPKRQAEPHGHSINPSPDNRFAIAADLGLDQLLVYRFDASKGTLASHDPPFFKLKPGAGPRHFMFHPRGRFAYAINELDSTVTALTWDARGGSFQAIDTVSTLPKEFTGTNSTAEVQVHPSGKFVYGSNRGHNSLAVFAADRSGKLTPVDHTPMPGKTPRNFRIDPSGTWLLAANQATNNVGIFRIDKNTGKLTLTGQPVEVPVPVCIRFLKVK